MTEPAVAISKPDFEAEIVQALAICDGDPIAALRATLIANAFLEAELERLVAMIPAGFDRGRTRTAPKTRRDSMLLRGAKKEEG